VSKGHATVGALIIALFAVLGLMSVVRTFGAIRGVD